MILITNHLVMKVKQNQFTIFVLFVIFTITHAGNLGPQ